jgi:acetylornithine/succinyldiaminopimelate/putrescine aminotransferase
MDKPKLLSVEDAKMLTQSEISSIFCNHQNPGQFHFLKLLGFEKVVIDSAVGMYYHERSGRKILDLFGGFGAVAIGHNHPAILAMRMKFQQEQRHEIAIAFMSQYAAALARNLAILAPGDLEFVFLGTSGSEVNEAALKLAEKVQGPNHSKVAYADHSFHGKTLGSLSVTDSWLYRTGFQLLNNRQCIPYGDAGALEKAFQLDPSIGILILETIQGGAGIILPPVGYWKEVRRLCDEYKVLWIADEVQCGMARTGLFFAFEHEEVVPDLVTLAKSLGGAKTAMAAMISRKSIFLAGYGSSSNSLIHGPATFSGMGEACCTAIETLHILQEEGLEENSAVQGAYLLKRLKDLQERYPGILKEVRGKGLMIGLEFQDLSKTFRAGLSKMIVPLDERLKGSVCGMVGSLLFSDFDILVAFTEYNRNVIRLEPPLILTREQVDYFVDSLKEILDRGITRIIANYLRKRVASWV